MATVHGYPIWFELVTENGALGPAREFYAEALGWQVEDSGMAGFTYHLARADGVMVAGLMEIPGDAGAIPPSWTLYFGVDDADDTASAIKTAGGQILREPADIPGTGRFAIAADPQGAAFGILQPDPLEDGSETGAFDQQRAGHGNWTELMSTDPIAGFAFYSDIFGWTPGDAIDMGEMGSYQLFRHESRDIGGMMGLGNAPQPCWLVYFGVNGVNSAIERIGAAGGTIHHGPMEVPGGAHIAIATDPQGAWFAVVGPLEQVP